MGDGAFFLALGAIAIVLMVGTPLLKRMFPGLFLLRLQRQQLAVVVRYFQYYGQLPPDGRRRFEHLVASFLNAKEWRGVGVELKDEMRVMISASAAQLLFGLPDLTLMHFDRILVYDDAYVHHRTGRRHQGEVNPEAGIIRISWAHFLEGYARPGDAHNVGLHEMAHALWFEDIIPNAEDDFLDRRLLERWKVLAQEEIERIRAGKDAVFRTYAGTNQEEFFAVAVEYFFEQPGFFATHRPALYDLLRSLLRQDPAAGMAGPPQKQSAPEGRGT